jgi:pyruvate dehydrogenase E2 component (dihydrolipoamide acetyltransferase)
MADFKLPDLGENIDSGDIVSVLVKEGDSIKAQQDVIEIETDKAVISVPSDVAGKVTKIHVARGQTVKPGQVILSLDAATGGGEVPAKASAPAKAKHTSAAPITAHAAAGTGAPAKPATPKAAPAKAAPAKAPAHKHAAPAARDGNGHSAAAPMSPAPVAVSAETARPIESPRSDANVDEDGAESSVVSAPAGPAVRRLARELGVDLARVSGTGHGGRITRDDVINAVRHANAVASTSASAVPASGAVERDSYGIIRRETMSKIRKTIAANMVRSATTIPHLTNFDDADITELERLRKESAASYADSGIKLTSLAFVLKAVALALKQHHTLNASLDTQSGEIVYKQYVNLGVAVDTDRGLVVPVLRGADDLSIPQIAQGIQALADKVRHGQQTLDDLRGGTFTISNLGAVGGQYSTPIINFPEVAILLVGRSRKIPVVTADDKIEPRLMMPLSLSYDHRLVDGAAASRFLNEVIGYLESPGRLLLAP